jgi:hypothetical protein
MRSVPWVYIKNCLVISSTPWQLAENEITMLPKINRLLIMFLTVTVIDKNISRTLSISLIKQLQIIVNDFDVNLYHEKTKFTP